MLLLKISCLLIVSKPCFYFMEISRIITLMWHKGSNLCWRIKEGPILTGELQTWVTTHTGLNIFCLMCKTWCNDRLILYKDMQKPKQRQAQAADEGTPTLARTDAARTHTHTKAYNNTQTQWKKRKNIHKKKNSKKGQKKQKNNTCTNTQTHVGLLLGEKCCWHKQNQHTKYREE